MAESDTYATYIKPDEIFKNKDEILFVYKAAHNIPTASWRRS